MKILWKFQSGAGVEGGMATYSIDGEQYVVALSFVGGDYVTAFKLGGTLGELPSPVLSAGAIRQGGGGTPQPATHDLPGAREPDGRYGWKQRTRLAQVAWCRTTWALRLGRP